MSQVYSDPSRAEDTYSLPDVEVFYADAGEMWKAGESRDGWEPEEDSEAGWYWWSCFPGCMPDSEANGPFETEEAATEDAQASVD